MTCRLTRALPLLGLLAASFSIQALEPIQDTPFLQEYREFLVQNDKKADDVRGVAVDEKGNVWSATAAGIFRRGEDGWECVQEEDDAGPAFVAERGPDSRIWFGAWNGIYVTSGDDDLVKIDDVDAPISAIGVSEEAVVALGPDGLWIREPDGFKQYRGNWANSARQAAFTGDGDSFYAATAHGMYFFEDRDVAGHWHREEELLTGDQRGVAIDREGRVWKGGFGGIDVYKDGRRVQSLSPREGLPCSDVRRLRFHPDGTLWICTALGAARYKDGAWSLRHSRRWLPSNEVRDVAFDGDGAAYVATAAGIAVIKRRMMTLAEKADHYYAICMARKVRDPWIVGDSRLLTPGDAATSSFEDDDNDGEYTNHYLAMEVFRYLVTGDPVARERAQKAAQAMERLQTVTGTSGFFARTMVPKEWADPGNENPNRLHDNNCTYTPHEVAEMRVENPRMKPVEMRWRPSTDGQWLWKGDSSSDEMVGHFFGYYVYGRFLAEGDEKARVAALAGRVINHLIDGGYVLRDIDGQPTLWGVWAPEILGASGDWRVEKCINALELLSFLKVAHLLTGDPRYDCEYKQMIQKHGYLDYARTPKPTAPSERTDIDSDLLALAFPPLMAEEKDPVLLAAYKEGLQQWFDEVDQDCSPFYSFMAGWSGAENIHLKECVDFLRDAPLDLIYWTVDNREREDLQLVRRPELYVLQTDRMLPPSERATMRWDKNPYLAISGDYGNTESTGVYWLLPYWLGRRLGYITPPQPPNTPGS